MATSSPTKLKSSSPQKSRTVAAKTPAKKMMSTKMEVPSKRISGGAQRGAQQNENREVAALTLFAAKAVATPTKAKRSRVPKDFADKYSTPQKERKIVAPLPVAEKKARKTASDRAKMRQLMTPDDDLMQRLARAQTLSTKVKVAPQRRSKNWESRCGKCGVTTTFSTPAALCAKCGAIAVRALD